VLDRSLESVPAGQAALVCAGSGLCAGFCFWPYRTGFLAFFILIPFLMFSGLRRGRARVLLNSFVFGLTYFLGSLYWIAMLNKDQITVPWLRLPAALVLCLYLSLFMILTGFLSRRLAVLGIPFEVAFALCWAGVEYLRSLGPLGFPWASIGYSQTPYLPILQQASVVGVYGLSFWIVLVNGMLTRMLLARKIKQVVAVVLVFVIPVIAGRAVLGLPTSHQGVSVSLVQPNISGSIKWDAAYQDSTMRILSALTVESSPSTMVIWPETAVPFYIRHRPAAMTAVAALARHTGSYILLGFPDYEEEAGEIRFYNSAMLVSPWRQVAAEYRKIHLVPFGEMIPFEDRFPFLRRIDLGEGDFSAGTEHTVFEVDGKRFGVAICFESIYPGLIRRLVDAGAGFIVNITNDEWFGPSLGPHQHAQMAVMRAVECGVGLARCANTGISMLVDPRGRVTARSRLFTQGTLTGTVAVATVRTPYLRVGRFLEVALASAALLLGALSCLPRYRWRQSV
jgi:apolipoprotein N-acyltransferase